MSYNLTAGDWFLLGATTIFMFLFYDRVLVPNQRRKELERRKNTEFVGILNALSRCTSPEALDHCRFRIMIFHAMYYKVGNGEIQLRDLEKSYIDKERELNTELFRKKSNL